MEEIKQRRMTIHYVFSFASEMLNFSYKTSLGSGDIDVPYEEIPKKSSILVKQNVRLRNIGYFLCIYGLILVGIAVGTGGGALLQAACWLISGFACLLGLGVFYQIQLHRVSYRQGQYLRDTGRQGS